MNNYDEIIKLLEYKVPFAIARFNDGEMGGILQPGNWVAARGDQPVNKELGQYLLDAFLHEQTNYWKGIPCSICFPQLRAGADQILASQCDSHYPHLCTATVLTNSNWKKAIKDIPKYLKGRTVYWIGGHDQKIDTLDFDIEQAFFFNNKDTWLDIKKIYPLWQLFQDDAVVMISLGPTARVLTKQWYQLRPDLTIIDIGSNFDPFTRDVWHRCHKGTLPHCSECNLV